MNKPDETKLKQLELASEPISRIAKYANNVTVGMLPDGTNVVMSFMSMDDEEHGVLIERIIIDKDHAKRIADLISQKLNPDSAT